jgi:hypothetical protein
VPGTPGVKGVGEAAQGLPVALACPLRALQRQHRQGESPPSLPISRGSDGGGPQARHRDEKAPRLGPLCPLGQAVRAAFIESTNQKTECPDTCQGEWWRVTEGYAGRHRRGLSATLRGFASPMRDTPGPRATTA